MLFAEQFELKMEFGECKIKREKQAVFIRLGAICAVLGAHHAEHKPLSNL